VNLAWQELGLDGLDALTGMDALCLFVAEDERPLVGTAGFVDWRLCGALSRVLVDRFFRGAEGETLLLPTAGRLPVGRIFVMGMGPSHRLEVQALGRVLGHAAEVLERAKVPSVALELPGEGVIDDGARAGALRTAFLSRLARAQVTVLGGREVAKWVQAG
jgi:hypothetical protein